MAAAVSGGFPFCVRPARPDGQPRSSVRRTAQAGGAPPLFNYQGLLLDVAGRPVPDGNYTLTLAIYDLPAGGFTAWAAAGLPVVE